MSVINQMLKDLDNRQNEQYEGTNVIAPTHAKNNMRKLVVIVLIVIIVLNIAAIFAWQLYTENQQLKMQAQQVASLAQNNQKNDRVIDENNNRSSGDVSETAIADKTTIADTQNARSQNSSQINDDIDDDLGNGDLVKIKAVGEKADRAKREFPKRIAATQRKKTSTLAISTEKPMAGEVLIPEPVVRPKSSLTISRSQLSPQALSAKKITQAQQAMEENNLTKAESLFEEVLLLMPEHKTARKQLAALWYGKKAYQDAINVLSQGIALDPQSQEMRLMSAKIYFEQGQKRQALNLLVPVNNSHLIELQVLLASAAAELNEHGIAVDAYRKLLELEPNVSRWWLGLAVSFDSQGDFSLASNAYNQAIAKGNLSNNALKFARQRISELGE